MTTNARTLAELVRRPREIGGDAYEVRHRWDSTFLARGPDGAFAFVAPLSSATQHLGRTFGQLALRFGQVRFDVGGRVWETWAALLECRAEDLLPTFVALAIDASERLGAGPSTPRQIIDVLSRWESLFRATRILSDTEEIGLWAELSLIRGATDPATAVKAWTGPFGSAADFEGGGVGVECKASFERLVHHFSVTQTHRPRGDQRAYIVSMWIGLDYAAGTSLPALVEQVSAVLDDPAEFEQKLLSAGYSRRDTASYSRTFLRLEPPLVFSVEHVPAIREYDRGIREIRYVAELDAETAESAEQAALLLARLGTLGSVLGPGV
jgi:hypothetical protein